MIRRWVILLIVCAAVVALMTKGILWLLPKVNKLLAGTQKFEADILPMRFLLFQMLGG